MTSKGKSPVGSIREDVTREDVTREDKRLQEKIRGYKSDYTCSSKNCLYVYAFTVGNIRSNPPLRLNSFSLSITTRRNSGVSSAISPFHAWQYNDKYEVRIFDV